MCQTNIFLFLKQECKTFAGLKNTKLLYECTTIQVLHITEVSTKAKSTKVVWKSFLNLFLCKTGIGSISKNLSCDKLGYNVVRWLQKQQYRQAGDQKQHKFSHTNMHMHIKARACQSLHEDFFQQVLKLWHYALLVDEIKEDLCFLPACHKAFVF